MMKKVHFITLAVLFSFAVVSCAQSQKEGSKDQKSGSGTTKGEVIALNAVEFNQQLSTTADKQIVDVRTPSEFETGFIAGAVNYNINDPQFNKQIESLDKSKPVFVYCLSGGRSASAAEKMKDMGFEHIYEMRGGMMSWKNQNLPVASGSAAIAADKFTRADYDQLVSANKLVLIDYFAPWCAPCKKMEPVLSKLAEEFKGKIVISRINVEEAKALTKEMKLEAVPVITTVKNGVETAHVTGYQSEEQFRALIAELMK